MKTTEYKGIANASIVKDVDVKQGIVTGYFSVFGVIDSDNDMIMPGAFLKTIEENGPTGKDRVLHLWQHQPTEPIGKPSVLKEDSYGLYFESRISKTTKGIDALKLYEDGVINEHSIGFNTVQKETKSNHTALLELKLWEGSTVTWGANEMARLTGMKSEGGLMEYLFNQKEKINNALRKGTYTDETFQLLIDQLTIFDTQMKDLFSKDTTEPEQKATTQPEIDEQSIRLMIQLTKQNLKNK